MKKHAREMRTRNFRQIELLVWLLILLAFFGISSFIHTKNKKSYELHNIFLPDVDGLIVGSPVNLMGVPVGYVTRMKIIREDEIFIRFIIKDKSIKLPKGTIANIEFSGLGGSKSIELYPPDKDYVQQYGLNANDYIIVAKPKRLHDCWDLLYQMFTKLGSIFDRIDYFGSTFKNSNLDEETLQAQEDINNFLEFSNDWVDNIQKKIPDNKINFNNINKKCRSKNNE